MSVLAITGGASGLGAAIARTASEEGSEWTDVVLLDRDEEAVTAVADELALSSYTVDVTDPQALRRTFAHLRHAHGDVAGLVSGAGLVIPGESSTFDTEDWRRIVDVDLSGVFYTAQAAFGQLRNTHGSIVHLSSIAAGVGIPRRAAYCAAKAGVSGLTASLAAEWAEHPIRVNAVGPAWVRTPMVQGLLATGVLSEAEMVAKIPLGRLGSVEDVSQAVMFLLSPERAGFITGQTLYVDGGLTTTL